MELCGREFGRREVGRRVIARRPESVLAREVGGCARRGSRVFGSGVDGELAVVGGAAGVDMEVEGLVAGVSGASWSAEEVEGGERWAGTRLGGLGGLVDEEGFLILWRFGREGADHLCDGLVWSESLGRELESLDCIELVRREVS